MDNGPPSETGWFFFHPIVWAAGLAGAMVSLVHAKGLGVWQRVGTLAVGTVTAGFLTPALAEALKMNLSFAAATGFLLGIAGMMLTAIVVNAATKAKEDPAAAAAWIFSWLGKKVPERPDNGKKNGGADASGTSAPKPDGGAGNPPSTG